MKSEIIKTLLQAGVLSFGEFELKSGRISPYFFNLGHIFQGQALSFIAQAYAALLHENFSDVSVLFGPAYKGIPLASTTATAYYDLYGLSFGVAFDRKEPKTHGEGGLFVGSALEGNIVLIDDVITAGSAVRSSLNKIKSVTTDCQVQGLVVAMDRQEGTVEGGPSTITTLQEDTGIQVRALLTFADLVAYLDSHQEENHTFQGHIKSMLAYRQKYGAKELL